MFCQSALFHHQHAYSCVFPLPMTCEELLARKPTTLSLVVSHDDDACPIDMMSVRQHGSCWRITPDEIDDGEVVSLFSEPVSDRDVTSLLASKELFFECGRYTLSISFSPPPDMRNGTVFKESKEIARYLGMSAVDPGSHLFQVDEKLILQLRGDRRGIECTSISSLTGEILGTVLIFSPTPGVKWNMKSALEIVKESIGELVSQYFGEVGDVEKRVEKYDSVINKAESILHKIKKR